MPEEGYEVEDEVRNEEERVDIVVVVAEVVVEVDSEGGGGSGFDCERTDLDNGKPL